MEVLGTQRWRLRIAFAANYPGPVFGPELMSTQVTVSGR
jgi:hypothetical protein